MNEPQSIEPLILTLRGQRVILDSDLAEIYGVQTKVLNQAVKRNSERFPDDFMFRLSEEEKIEVVTNCDHLQKLKFSPQLPYAFTEHGAIMASMVLNMRREYGVSWTHSWRMGCPPRSWAASWCSGVSATTFFGAERRRGSCRCQTVSGNRPLFQAPSHGSGPTRRLSGCLTSQERA